MPVQKKTSIYFAIELSLREISVVVYVHALMTQKSCAVGMRNAILRNHLNKPGWPGKREKSQLTGLARLSCNRGVDFCCV